MVMSTVKKLKELCYGSTTGVGEIPQKTLKEIRTTRDKPYDKLRNKCFRQRIQHGLKRLRKK